MADTGIVAPGLHGTTLSGLSFGTTSSHSPNLLTQSLNRRMNLSIQGNNNGSDNATVYANAFSVQPSHLPYRAPQTVKPLIDGPQIATVVGPEGEEIHTDQYGRVKVHFPWDRHKDPKAEDSSCWIRVSMNWGGGKYGHVALPRIGHEVIVDFLEGDPDQPIITGRTYHASNQPPYKLPENKTKMVIRSDTHKGEGFNEISFEDEADQEQIYIYAQKDETIEINNDKLERIRHDETRYVGHDYEENISNNKTIYVQNEQSTQIGKSKQLHIGETLNQYVERDTVFETGNILKETIGASRLIEVGRNQKETIQGVYEIIIGDRYIVKTANLNIDASSGIQIRGPGGKIIINENSITLESPTINLKGAVNVENGFADSVEAIKSAIKNELPMTAGCIESTPSK
ncbi:type VI secretion system tip protein TssI/VgrG [Bartonella sp. HY038]|uniref:type VI secretion system tip protein TssI/VgrG n=1 Tax=Bartonella sp. HY038 TaxID=2759660 RepID=UPI0015F984E7